MSSRITRLAPAARPSPEPGPVCADACAPIGTATGAVRAQEAKPSASSRPLDKRTPRNQQRLHCLRRELAKIGRSLPLPPSAAAAREHILDALARAGLGGWSVPALDDPATRRCPDGSYGIALVSHVVWLNPWGAFRIVDLHRPQPAYFEVAGDGQRAFVPPQASTTPV